MRSRRYYGILSLEPEQSGFFMQLARGSLGILRDRVQQLDVLKNRGCLTFVDNCARLLIFNFRNALQRREL